MKKFLALMLCLVMALSLVACAKDNKDKDKPNTDLPTNDQPNTAPNANNGITNNGTNNGANNGTTNGTTPNDGVTAPGNGTGDTAGDNAKTRSRNSTVTDPYRSGSIFSGSAEGMATWEQMIDNGRVRDTDGFLWDGENASWT